MSSSIYTTAEGVVVVTHVHPQDAPRGAGLPHCVGIQKLGKNRLQLLGTIQVMVGLILLLFGIAMVVNADTLSVFTGIWVWGAIIYITAGGLTVAAGKYVKRPLVNAALSFCVIAAVCSTTGTILYTLDAVGVISQCYDYNSQYTCYMYQSRTQGFSGILAIFNLLELIVSIVVAGFACSATCNCSGEPREVIIVPAAPVLPNVPEAAQPIPQVQNNSKNPELRAGGESGPPTYDSVIS